MAILLSREQIVDMIRSSEKTRDGYYWCPWFIKKNVLNYNHDEREYFYHRKYFAKKVIFSETDIDFYLAKEKMDCRLFDDMLYHDCKFFNDNYELLGYRIYDRVPGTQFTIEELIDCFYFIIK